MIEVVGDLWIFGQPVWARVITTNGFVKSNGECVMGRGCALEAARLHPSLPRLLGGTIQSGGNHVYCMQRGPRLFTFPVKHHWREQADPALIERSAHELVAIIDELAGKGVQETVVMPRPGCGNGRLKWEDVRALLAPILDERFHVITYE